MKFDTRDKKPKVFNILILSGIVAAITAVLMISNFAGNILAVAILAAVYFLTVILMLVNAFFKQLQYNPYSYNTIFYIGFALFVTYLFAVQILLCVRMILRPEYSDIDQILQLLLGSAKNYMILTFPLILIFSAGLCVSNISLIRHEGFRPVNLLGIILSVFLVGGAIAIYVSDFYVTGDQSRMMVHDIVTNSCAAFYLYFESMMLGVIVALVIAAKHEPAKDKDFMIILGCAVRKDGTPTPLLRGRVDRAIAFYKKQLEETGKELLFVPSGGKGSDEVVSECASMTRYLIEQGIPERLIIQEDQSTTTYENMIFSKDKIMSENPGGKIAFATTNFHVFRGGLLARRMKMRAVGVGADTKWYYWPNASVREFAALIASHRGKQALILLGMIAVYVALTLLVYM